MTSSEITTAASGDEFEWVYDLCALDTRDYRQMLSVIRRTKDQTANLINGLDDHPGLKAGLQARCAAYLVWYEHVTTEIVPVLKQLDKEHDQATNERDTATNQDNDEDEREQQQRRDAVHRKHHAKDVLKVTVPVTMLAVAATIAFSDLRFLHVLSVAGIAVNVMVTRRLFKASAEAQAVANPTPTELREETMTASDYWQDVIDKIQKNRNVKIHQIIQAAPPWADSETIPPPTNQSSGAGSERARLHDADMGGPSATFASAALHASAANS